MTFEFDFFSAFHNGKSCHLVNLLNPFRAFITTILSLRYHFDPIFGFHYTHFVTHIPFSTQFGLWSHPFCHSDTISNPF